MLGRIFENLLAEINPETGENAKKSTGSFYTPRDIVDYMVDSSLLEYLKNKTNIEEARLKALISYGKEDDSIAVFNLEEKKNIINALYNITILDPACGSGAFPIGMLQKIVYILQEVDPDANLWFDKATENVSILLKKEFEKKFNAGSLDYIRKLSVIQNSIFGIDIQPIAVEISRLRCFLSLVIEENVNDEEDNRGINPLPNLDFKFISANSLISLDDSNQLSLLEDEEQMKRLKEIRDEYFGTNDLDLKKDLISEFKDVQQDMLLKTINTFAKTSSAKYQKLSAWKPFSNESTDWFDPDWMFGIKDGFDIVIGNPPYVQLQKMHKDADKIAKMHYKTFARTSDLYCIFYEFGYKILKKNGILIYITSNKWMRAEYGNLLRNFFVKYTNPLLLIDFFGTKVFDSATVDVNILLFQKSKNKYNTKCCIIKDDCMHSLNTYIESNISVMEFKTLDDNWTILNPIELSIKNKIEAIGTPIKDWGLNINRGILTGFNEAFIIDEATKNKLIEEDPKSAEIIRPILRGKDIKKYKIDFKNLYIINSHNGNKNSNEKPIDINQYPAIKAHLDKFYDKLEKRCDKGDTPYNLRNCIYMDDFFKQKIIYSEIVQSPQFYLDNEYHFFPEATTFIMSGSNLELAIACLNSTLYSYSFKKFYSGGGLGEHGYRYKKVFLEKLPLPNIENSELIEKIKNIVNNISESTDDEEVKKYEQEIDNILYNLAGINKEEKGMIEN